MEVMEVHNGPATPPVMRTKWHGRWVGVKCVTTMKMPNATLKSWLYRNDAVSEPLFIVGIVTFVICFTLPFVFIAGFLVMKVMRTKGKVKQMTKVTILTTKRGSDTVVPVESGLYCG